VVSGTRDRFGAWTHNLYDARGNLIETRTESKDESGQDTWIVTRTVYDNNGRVVYAVDAYADPDPYDTEYFPAPGTHTIYDPLGRVIETERLEGIVINLVDDPVQDDPQFVISQIVDSGDVLTTSQTFYDPAGRVDYTRAFEQVVALACGGESSRWKRHEP
jgi:hypothetical protein